MVTATWTPEAGWHDARVRAHGPITLSPAAAVLHYAQEIFEGLKAYRHDDGTVWGFRPDANAARFARSARRLALPVLPEELFLASIEALVRTDVDWVPSGGESSLYLRPFMFASESFLGVRPAHEVTYCVIASPAGAYFSGGVSPVSIWLSTEYTRAAPRRHRRGQVRRQLRREPGPAAGGLRARLRAGAASSTPPSSAGSRSSAG